MQLARHCARYCVRRLAKAPRGWSRSALAAGSRPFTRPISEEAKAERPATGSCTREVPPAAPAAGWIGNARKTIKREDIDARAGSTTYANSVSEWIRRNGPDALRPVPDADPTRPTHDLSPTRRQLHSAPVPHRHGLVPGHQPGPALPEHGRCGKHHPRLR